jgi:hypothetical protein
VTLGTRVDASHALRLMTSILIRNRAVASAFISPIYSLRGSYFYRVSQVASGLSRGLIASLSYLSFYLFYSLYFNTISCKSRGVTAYTTPFLCTFNH